MANSRWAAEEAHRLEAERAYRIETARREQEGWLVQKQQEYEAMQRGMEARVEQDRVRARADERRQMLEMQERLDLQRWERQQAHFRQQAEEEQRARHREDFGALLRSGALSVASGQRSGWGLGLGEVGLGGVTSLRNRREYGDHYDNGPWSG